MKTCLSLSQEHSRKETRFCRALFSVRRMNHWWNRMIWALLISSQRSRDTFCSMQFTCFLSNFCHCWAMFFLSIRFKTFVNETFLSVLIKQSWREHLQKYFWQLKNTYNRFIKIDKSKTVSCSDLRCAMSFDSIQDLQCHCQNVHCIERIKLDSIKRRCRTHLFFLNVKTLLEAIVKLKYHCDLLKQEISLSMSMNLWICQNSKWSKLSFLQN